MEAQPYAHAINVALLALQLGKKLHLNDLQLRDVALGSLFHDVGKEIEGEEHHAVKGFEYLRKERELSLLCAHMAYQHHEHADGSGTPRGLKETDIHLYAQICAIANEYENLISAEFVPPHEALEIIMARSGIRYSQQIVRLFVETIPAYLPGTMVKMGDGRNAIVTKSLNICNVRTYGTRIHVKKLHSRIIRRCSSLDRRFYNFCVSFRALQRSLAFRSG